MSIISRMIVKMVFLRFFGIIVGISLFVLTLEVVTYASDITALAPGSPSIVLRYIMMRMPATLATFLPMSLLLAMLLTLTTLSLRNETVALWASGLSPAKLVVMLSPVFVGCGIIHFLLVNTGVPSTAPVLREWAIADYGKKRLNVSENDPIWLRNDLDVIRAVKASANSSKLEHPIIFKRDSDGLLTQYIEALSAERNGNDWKMKHVTQYGVDGRAPIKLAEFTYAGAIRPAMAGSRSGDPEEMSLGELSYFITNQGFGIRPVHVYQTWWHKRISTLTTALVIIALCVPFATGFRRGGGLGMLFAVAVGLGFVYFIFDGIFLSLGVMGFLTPWLASWLPNMAFGSLAALLLLRGESMRAG
jgi:lipopolysaccharide export system permease protein